MSADRNVGTATSRSEPPPALATGLRFPEGLRWYRGALWFSDIHGHRVHRLTSEAKLETVATLADRPSGLGFLPDGTPLVVSELDRRILALEPDGGTRVHADLSSFGGDFLNDMVVDGDGRAWVGNRRDSGYARGLGDGIEEGREQLILAEPDGRTRLVADGLVSPNGMVLTPDGGTLVVAETRAHRLTAFDVAADGSLSHRRRHASTGERFPDGIALDAEGAIWLGSPVTHEFVRVGPSGRVLDVIDVAPEWAVALALGGADRRTLYLAACSNSLENLERLGHDRTLDATSTARGVIRAVGVEQPGVGWP